MSQERAELSPRRYRAALVRCDHGVVLQDWDTANLKDITGAQHSWVCLHIKGLHESQCDQEAIFYLDTVAAGAEQG